jgi:hypothetical protein
MGAPSVGKTALIKPVAGCKYAVTRQCRNLISQGDKTMGTAISVAVAPTCVPAAIDCSLILEALRLHHVLLQPHSLFKVK